MPSHITATGYVEPESTKFEALAERCSNLRGREKTRTRYLRRPQLLLRFESAVNAGPGSLGEPGQPNSLDGVSGPTASFALYGCCAFDPFRLRFGHDWSSGLVQRNKRLSTFDLNLIGFGLRRQSEAP
jgi:hypothetical protein